jgi:ribose-phosphate pyrophosphokinase
LVSRYAGLSVYTGNTHPAFARAICNYLEIELGKAEVFKFQNDNIFVKINENVRERDVFIVQSLCRPVSDSIMELLIMIDACKRASAGRITAVIPFYAYGRSDKKDQPRVPITARLLADMITVAGADRVLTMDLHQAQIQGFFNVPVDELTGFRVLTDYFRGIAEPDSFVVVVPDLGFAAHGRRLFAEPLRLPLAVIEKKRKGNTGRSEAMNLIGEVRGLHAVLVDDEILTGGTVLNAVELLREEGVRDVYVATVHGLFADEAAERLIASPIEQIVTTDSVPIPVEMRDGKIEVRSVAPLFGEAIRRIHEGESVGALFTPDSSMQVPLRIAT